MNNQSLVISERIDDVVLLLKMMIQIGLPELLTEYLPRHWHQKGLDWGWVAVIWLSYILSEGDHRKVMVREWVNQRKNMLEQVCGISIGETDFTDDRLGIVLKRLSEPKTWLAIETELTRNSIRIYDLPTSTMRMDATTMSGYHLVSEEGLFQWGHSKGDPNLPQIKVMMASLDPLGMPTATHVVSGEKADDGLYIPIFDQVRETVGKSGLLWVGDCKMSALATRAHIYEQGHYYLTPLSRVGKIDQQLRDWLAESAIKDWSQLKREGESLVGLYPGNPKKVTQRPTTERLLKAFDNITLTIFNIKGEEYGYVTPLNQVQKKILRLLGLDSEIYSSLAESPG